MKIVLVIFGFIILPVKLNAQMSEHLVNLLADSIKPANRQQVSLPEFGRIMQFGKWHLMKDDRAIRELDSLVVKWAPRYPTIPNKKDRVEYLFYLTGYWNGRVETYMDSMLKYNLIIEAETKDDIKHIEAIAGTVAVRQAVIYRERKDFKKSFSQLIKAIDIFGQTNDSVQLCKTYLYLAGLYTKLGSFKKAEECVESADRYDTKANHTGIASYRVSEQVQLYLMQFAQTKETQFVDRLENLVTEYNDSIAYEESTSTYFKAEIFFIKSQLNYYQGNFQQSLQYFDSTFLELKGIPTNINDYTPNYTFRVLSLMQLGREKEAIDILEKLEPQMDEFYTGLMLDEIYKYYKKTDNLSKALEYHEKLVAYNANAQLLKHQGELIEMEQQYNVAARDLQITRLKAQQDQFRYIAIILATIALAAIAFIINWQRNIRRKNQKLIQQVEELTQLQIIRIEEAEQKAQELERKRIGQELHDDLASTMAGLLQFMRAKILNESNEAEKTNLTKAVAMLENSYEKTRSKSHEIYYRPTEDYFTEMLADNINLVFKDSGINVQVEIDKLGMNDLSADVKTNLLYIMKEAIANIIKHAKATLVEILLYNSNNHIYLEINDNGVGFFRRQNKTSLGLSSMKKRIEDLRGTFQIDSLVKGGTQLKMVLPENQPEKSNAMVS